MMSVTATVCVPLQSSTHACGTAVAVGKTVGVAERVTVGRTTPARQRPLTRSQVSAPLPAFCWERVVEALLIAPFVLTT
jgi:hypothetical protein